MSFRYEPVSTEYFYYPEEREDIFLASRNAVDYVQSNEITAIVLLDRTARPIWKGIKDYWQQTTPNDQPVPSFFFIDPAGFKANFVKTADQVAEQMRSEHPYLFGHRDKPVLLLDTCIHKGDSMRPIIRDLSDVGFSKLLVGVVDNRRNRSEIQPDVTLLPWMPRRTCAPFGPDALTEHQTESLIATSASQKNRLQPVLRSTSLQFRAEIGAIISEGIENGGVFSPRSYNQSGLSPEVAQSILDHLGIVTFDN